MWRWVVGSRLSGALPPPTNRTWTLTSTSANLLLATTPAGPFSQSITLLLLQGSASGPSFSMQGLANTGSAQLTATAAGYTNGTATVDRTPTRLHSIHPCITTTPFSLDTTLHLSPPPLR